MIQTTLARYNDAIFDTDRDQALAVIRQALEEGLKPEQVVFEVIIPAVNAMIDAISADFDANLAQHFLAARIAAEVTEEMLPLFETRPESPGTVVIGTAFGDLHSLGRRIVCGCLQAMLVEVVDLGAHVAPERFVAAAIEHDAQVIAVSAMMVHTACGERGPLAVRQQLAEQGLEHRIKLVVGGAPYRFDPELYLKVGADGWAPDGMSAGREILRLIEGVPCATA